MQRFASVRFIFNFSITFMYVEYKYEIKRCFDFNDVSEGFNMEHFAAGVSVIKLGHDPCKHI